MEQILAFLQPLIEAYGGSQGWLLQAITIIGSLRVFFKPMMSFAHTYVLFTETKKDDLKLKEIEDGKIYKGIMYFIDWFASIKPKKK